MDAILDPAIDSLYLLLAIFIPLVHITLGLLNDTIHLIITELVCLFSNIRRSALSIILWSTSPELGNRRLLHKLVVV